MLMGSFHNTLVINDITFNNIWIYLQPILLPDYRLHNYAFSYFHYSTLAAGYIIITDNMFNGLVFIIKTSFPLSPAPRVLHVRARHAP